MTMRTKMYAISDKYYQGGLPHSLNEFDSSWAVVSLCFDYCISDDGDMHSSCIGLRFPIHDAEFPGLDWLKAVIACMEQADKLDKKIYVHCLAGVSRSTMVMAAFLMKKNKCSADSALNFIAKVNPSIDPNPHFLKGLSEWETFLKNGGTSG